MQRFDAFLGQAETLAGYDYLFFANANLRCLRDVTAAELLPDAEKGQTLTVVCHLPYYGKNPIFHPYERRRKSRACIPYNCGTWYVAGGLNGGQSAAYLELCRELKARTDEDTGREAVRVLQKSHYIDMRSVRGPVRRQNWVQRKWGAFCENWLPYLWWARDALLRRSV